MKLLTALAIGFAVALVVGAKVYSNKLKLNSHYDDVRQMCVP